MVCKKCGAEIEQGMKFCTQCGEPCQQNEAGAKEKKSKKKKGGFVRFIKRLLIGIVVFLVLLATANIIGHIEITRLNPIALDPSVHMNIPMEKELRDELDGVVYTATVSQNPEKIIKDYVNALKQKYGFEIDYVDTYSYRTDSYLYYRLEHKDISIFGKLANEMLYEELPTITVCAEREKATDPYELRISIDDTILLY